MIQIYYSKGFKILFSLIVVLLLSFSLKVNAQVTENFNACSPLNTPDMESWKEYSVLDPNKKWLCTSFGKVGNAPQISAGLNPPNNEDWLISPALNLEANATLSFWARTRFLGPALKLKVSSNYTGIGDPNLATWTDIDGQFPGENTDIWKESANIDLSNFAGENVYLAFVYKATIIDGSPRWTIDEIAINNASLTPNVKFEKAIEEKIEDAGEYDVTLTLSTPPKVDKTVDILITNGANVTYGADYETNPVAVNEKITVVIPANSNAVSFKVKILDDIIVEDSENITFTLANPSNGLLLGTQTAYAVTLIDNEVTEANFEKATEEKLENAGEYDVTITLSAPPKIDKTIDVLLTNGVGVAYGADYTTTPVMDKDKFTVVIPANATSISFKVQILDDLDLEEGENITFTLANPSDGLLLGLENIYTLTIIDNEPKPKTIQELRKNDALGIPIYNQAKVQTIGTVYGINLNKQNANALQFTIIDNDSKAGINVWYEGANDLGYVVKEGDKITISGILTHKNGFTTLIPEEIIKNAAVNLIVPTVVKSFLQETHESSLIKLELVKLISGWGTVVAHGGYDVVVSDGVVDYQIRIDDETDIIANYQNNPPKAFNITGLVSQNDPSTPYDANYQLAPRRVSDLEILTGFENQDFSSDLKIFPNPSSSNITLAGLREETYQATIFNTVGKKVMVHDNVKNMHKISVANLPKGVYILTIASKKSIITKRLIVQ